MIRFIPDTWRDSLLRPLAMAAPDAGVYAEVMAPDMRFVFVAILAAVALLLWKRTRLRADSPVTMVLLGIVVLAFLPWLATSGNGRYFIPFLLAAGPLCLALTYWLPWRKRVKLVLALGMVVVQGYVALDSQPWRSWGLATWGAGEYFQISVPSELRATPATYVTMTSISYSLIAPQFHPQSRWINISAMAEDPRASIETRVAHKIFRESQRLLLVIPSLPAHMTADGQPNPELQDVVDRQLAPQRLALARPVRCELAPSRGVAAVAIGNPEKARPATLTKLGFWFCPLRFSVEASAGAPQAVDAAVDAAFEKIERSCPRLFPPGEAPTSRIKDGAVRNYSSTDIKLYVLNDGNVYYKYWRALNPENIGTLDSVSTPGFKMDCNTIRGRSGLPWERKL